MLLHAVGCGPHIARFRHCRNGSRGDVIILYQIFRRHIQGLMAKGLMARGLMAKGLMAKGLMASGDTRSPFTYRFLW